MILIVDDDVAIRHSLGMMLKRARYEVEAVASPQEALDVVRKDVPQLILMDMNFSQEMQSFKTKKAIDI